jgi:predicted PurR-regulated permease PerM
LLAGLWYAADALLLIFACMLFAILLYELSEVVKRRLRLQRKFALPLVVTLLLAVIGIGGWLMAPQIAQQSDTLAETIPKAITELRNTLNQNDPAAYRQTSS